MLISPVCLQQLAEADIQFANLSIAAWGQDNTTIEYGYDDNGSMTSKVTKTTSTPQETIEAVAYEYNLQNRLSKVTTTPYVDGVAQTPIVAEYKYDPDGNRMQKTDGAATTTYLVDSQNLTGYSQVFVETTGVNKTAYIIGDDVLAQATGTQQADIQYLLYDGHGSTRQLTSNSGTVVPNESYSYDAYGVMLGGDRATETSLLYTGEQYDSSAQMYYLRARYYDPSNGRFNQTDPFAGIKLNLHIILDAIRVRGLLHNRA